MFGLDYVIFRPHNVYGERQNIGDKYRNVIGIFMNQLLQGKAMTIFGDGKQTRAFSYVSDVAPVIARAAERPASWNQIFNVGADQAYSVLELSRVVARAMGVEPRVLHEAPRNEVLHAFSSHARVQQHFGDLIRNVPLEDGVGRMAEWAKGVGARQSVRFPEIEVEKNMPPSWRAALAD
jgi:UDP-glucose 4-epimerase